MFSIKNLTAIAFISIAIIISIAGYLYFAKSKPAQAQVSTNHYIRSNATGLNNGSDWNNAYTTLPATLIRGDIYYIADGDYPTYKVDDAVSGTSVITIKKAIIADHGTEVGWDNIFGDGQAVFAAPFNIVTSYVVFDGVVGSGSDPTSYGFKLTATNCAVDNNSMLGMPPMGYYALSFSDITVSHISLIHCGSGYDTEQRGIYSFSTSVSNMKVTHTYVKDASTNMLLKWNNGEVSHNYFAGNWSSTYSHGQQIDFVGPSSNVTVKNNIFKDSTVFAIMTHNTNNNYYKIYNNIFIGGVVSGIISTDPVINSARQWQVNNNTFFKVKSAGYGAFTPGSLSDPATDRSYAYNNLFYSVDYPNLENSGKGSSALIHDYNLWIDSTNLLSTEANQQINAGDPFFNSVNNDFRLKEATNSGFALSSPFDKDFLGNARGSDGVWDRGAYEYIQAPPPLKGDFNSDSKVNNLDFTSFKNAFKSIFNAIFDLNSDNTIDVKDLGVLMSGWLE